MTEKEAIERIKVVVKTYEASRLRIERESAMNVISDILAVLEESE